MAAGHYKIDTTRWPLVLVTCEGSVDDAEFGSYIAGLKAVLGRKQRYGCIVDARTAGPPTINQRRMQSEFQTEQAGALRTYCMGVAFVTPSAVLRGILSAIMWMASPPFDYAVVEDPQEAEAWLEPRIT